MYKTKRIKSIILTLFIFLSFLSDVSASSYTGFDFNAQLYDNFGPTLNSVTTSGPTAGTGAYEGYIGYTANSSGGAWGISSPVSLIANHTYTLTASIPNECSNIILSTYNRIGVGTTLNNAKISYENNTNVNEVYSKAIQGSNYLIQFAFTPTINGSFIVFPYATSKSCSSTRTFLESISIEDLGVEGVTQDEINNSLNNQTNEINNSIQNSTDTIINNQNQNNEELKDSINDNFNSCRDSVNLLEFQGFYSDTNNNIISKINSDGSLNITGTPTQQWANLAYNRGLILEPGTYTFSTKDYQSIDIALRLYKNDNSYTNYTLWPGQKSITFTLEEPAIWYYVFISRLDTSKNYNLNLYLQLEKGSISTSWEKPGEICSNKIDETNDKLDNIGGALTDSSPTDMSGLGNSAGWLPAGPVDSILTLPLTMLNSLVTNLSNNTCQTVSVQLPYVKENIILPCIKSLYDKMGVTGTLFTTAGLIGSAFILFNYLLSLYKWVDDTLTMRENTMPGYFDDNWGGGA